MEEHLIFFAGVLILGIASQWVAWRFRLPSILILLLVGFLSGQVAPPSRFLDEQLLFAVVSLAVSVILFEGGLSLRFRELRETSRAISGLVTVGVLITWVLAGLFAWLLFDMTVAMAAVCGAILTVSGPTVILPILRQIRPNRRVGSLAKWEGIVNDPIGALLAVLVFEAVIHGGVESAAWTTAWGLVMTAVVGILGGLGGGIILIQLMAKNRIPDFLESAVLLSFVLGLHVLSNAIQPESGLITVTLFGIVMANQRRIPIHHLVEFKENLRVLLLSSLFILLSARLELDRVTQLGFSGIAFLLLLILVVRPLAVLAGTWGSKLPWRERLFIGFLAPRGIVAAAVSSIFALDIQRAVDAGELDEAILPGARLLVPLVFLVIVGTVVFYGLAAAPLARALGIAEPDPHGILIAGADPLARELGKAISSLDEDVLLVDTNHRNVSKARMDGLPAVCANILSEYVREELELSGIGRLMAVTRNDEVNSLATLHFSDNFGRANVYQLPPVQRTVQSRDSVAQKLRGKTLFAPDATYSQLAERIEAGATIKKTSLTDEFDFQAFRDTYGSRAIPMFVIDRDGKIAVWTSDRTTPAKPGQTVISLVDPGVPAPKAKRPADAEPLNPGDAASPSETS